MLLVWGRQPVCNYWRQWLIITDDSNGSVKDDPSQLQRADHIRSWSQRNTEWCRNRRLLRSDVSCPQCCHNLQACWPALIIIHRYSLLWLCLFMLLKSERIIIPSLVTYRQEIIGIYHGVSKRVSKRELPLFVNKQVYRYNHRKIGRNMLDEIAKYLRLSSLMPGKGNHSVIGSGNDLFCSLMCQVATHSIRKIDQII